jgi:hypothetical protein
LVLAQSVAQVHALKHLGGDAPVAPGQHSQLCIDCVSHTPLLVMAGGVAVVLFLALRVYSALRLLERRPPFVRAAHPAFRSRAPPR